MTPEQNSTTIETGRAALARGAWDEACRAFSACLEEGETPDLLEGLGWAQWWLNDPESSMRNRERAYRLLRQAGDCRGAARVATGLGVDAVDLFGEPIARGWLERARRLLSGFESSAEFGRLALWEGHLALYADHDAGLAREKSSVAGTIARSVGLIDLEMMALALDGLILISEGQVPEGMRRLDEATMAAISGEMADLDSVAQTCCLLIHACTRVQDYERATIWSRRIQEFCRVWQVGSVLSVCRTQFAAVLISDGRWAEAETQLALAIQELLTVRPALLPEAQERLGDLRWRQGRWDEAAELFAAAEPRSLAICGRGRLALDAGDAAGAAGLLERCLRRAAADSYDVRGLALERLVRARLQLGARAEAERAFEELERLAARVATGPLKALANLARAALAIDSGDCESASRALEDAIDFYEERNAPFEAARTRLDLAACLVKKGRNAAALRETRTALDTLSGVGAARECGRAERMMKEIAPETEVGTSTGRASEPSPAAVDRNSAHPAGSAGSSSVQRAPAARLTPRECEILRLISGGLADKEVADRLKLSEHTVHRHVANILTKMKLPSRAAAVAEAIRMNLI